MWTNSPRPRPGGASRTEREGRGGGGNGTGHWLAWAGGCGGRGHPLSPWPYPLCLVLHPSPLCPPPSVTPPLLSQTQQEAGPGFALLGTSPQVGACRRGGLWPWKDLGSLGEAWLPGRGRDLRASPTPAWGGVIPAHLLCLMGRPSHNWEPRWSQEPAQASSIGTG